MKCTNDVIKKYIDAALAQAKFEIVMSNSDRRNFAAPVEPQNINKRYSPEEFLDELNALMHNVEVALSFYKELHLKVLGTWIDEEKDIYFPVIYVREASSEEADEYAGKQVVICPTKSIAETLDSKNNLFLTFDEIRTRGIFIMPTYTI